MTNIVIGFAIIGFSLLISVQFCTTNVMRHNDVVSGRQLEQFAYKFMCGDR